MILATENLEKEHLYILRLAAIMEKIATNQIFNKAHIESLVFLIRNYADGIHHAKEEKVLFLKVFELPKITNDKTLENILKQHEQGRRYADYIDDHLSFYLAGIEASLQELYKTMLFYVSFIREHINFENNVLFPHVIELLKNQDHIDIQNQFSILEKSSFCGNIVAEFEKKIDQLAKEYDIS